MSEPDSHSDLADEDKITAAYKHFIDILNKGDNIRDVR